MARRRHRQEKAQEIEEIIEDAEDLAYSAQEDGVEKAVDDYIGEKIREATQKAAIRRFGNHPALIMLPEFIEAQKGYGPAAYEETSTDLRRELGLESEDPTLEDVEQIFEDSELLEDIINEELEEIDDIIEQLDEKDLEQIVTDFEEEIPNEEIETDEHEEDGKKCHSISIGFGDDKITFNTCDKNDNFDDNELNEIDEKSDGGYEIPDIPGNGLWCPVIKEVATWSDLYWFTVPSSTGESASRENFTRDSKITDWIASNTRAYREWFDEQRESRRMSRIGRAYYITINYVQEGSTGTTLDWDNLGGYYRTTNDKGENILKARRTLPGSYVRLRFPPVPWYINSGTEAPEDRIYCLFDGNSNKPPTEDNRRNPWPIRERRGEDKVNEDCCKATLSLTRKIARNTGATSVSNEKYPTGIRPVSTSDDYGFPFKVPKAWLEPGKTGEITIYNSKQLLLILGRMLAENHQALASDELLHEGVEYENKWTTPGGTGTTKVWNYLELFEVLARQGDHLGIHPFVGQVADLNPAKPGDQPLNTPTLNATHAIKMIYESIKETDGDQAAALNLNLRESILLGQLALAVASMSETLISVAEALGFEVNDAVDVFDNFPFDFTLGAEAEVTGGKGFGKEAQVKYIAQLQNAYKKIVDKLVDNTEESAEAVLERFLVTKPQQFIYKKLQANSSILEAIRNVQSK